MSTPIKPLEQLQKEADAAIAALNAGKKLKMENDRKAFKTKLESAQTAFKELDKDSQLAALEDEAIKELFAFFGLVKRKASKRGGGGGGKGGGKFNKYKDLILAELATGPKKQKFIEEKFGISHQSLRTWVTDKNKFKGLVKVNDDGRDNEWSKI